MLSAATSIVLGTPRPSRFAVRRLMMSSNFRRLQNREIGGLGATRDLADMDAGLAVGIHEVDAIAHQSAAFGKLPPLVDRRQSMTRHQRHDLLAPAQKQRIGARNTIPACWARVAMAGSISAVACLERDVMLPEFP